MWKYQLVPNQAQAPAVQKPKIVISYDAAMQTDVLLSSALANLKLEQSDMVDQGAVNLELQLLSDLQAKNLEQIKSEIKTALSEQGWFSEFAVTSLQKTPQPAAGTPIAVTDPIINEIEKIGKEIAARNNLLKTTYKIDITSLETQQDIALHGGLWGILTHLWSNDLNFNGTEMITQLQARCFFPTVGDALEGNQDLINSLLDIGEQGFEAWIDYQIGQGKMEFGLAYNAANLQVDSTRHLLTIEKQIELINRVQEKRATNQKKSLACSAFIFTMGGPNSTEQILDLGGVTDDKLARLKTFLEGNKNLDSVYISLKFGDVAGKEDFIRFLKDKKITTLIKVMTDDKGLTCEINSVILRNRKEQNIQYLKQVMVMGLLPPSAITTAQPATPSAEDEIVRRQIAGEPRRSKLLRGKLKPKIFMQHVQQQEAVQQEEQQQTQEMEQQQQQQHAMQQRLQEMENEGVEAASALLPIPKGELIDEQNFFEKINSLLPILHPFASDRFLLLEFKNALFGNTNFKRDDVYDKSGNPIRVTKFTFPAIQKILENLGNSDSFKYGLPPLTNLPDGFFWAGGRANSRTHKLDEVVLCFDSIKYPRNEKKSALTLTFDHARPIINFSNYGIKLNPGMFGSFEASELGKLNQACDAVEADRLSSMTLTDDQQSDSSGKIRIKKEALYSLMRLENRGEAESIIAGYQEIWRSIASELDASYANTRLKLLGYLLVDYGCGGIQILFDKLEALRNKSLELYNVFFKTFVNSSANFTEFLSKESLDALDKIAKFTPAQITWWNTLVTQHVYHNQTTRLDKLVNGFEYFCKKYKDLYKDNKPPMELLAREDLPSVCPFKDVKNMPVALDRLLAILERSRKAFKRNQQPDFLDGMDLSAEGAYYATQHNRFYACNKEMDLFRNDKPMERLSYTPISWIGDSNIGSISTDEIKRDLFRFIGQQKYAESADYYEKWFGKIDEVGRKTAITIGGGFDTLIGNSAKIIFAYAATGKRFIEALANGKATENQNEEFIDWISKITNPNTAEGDRINLRVELFQLVITLPFLSYKSQDNMPTIGDYKLMMDILSRHLNFSWNGQKGSKINDEGSYKIHEVNVICSSILDLINSHKDNSYTALRLVNEYNKKVDKLVKNQRHDLIQMNSVANCLNKADVFFNAKAAGKEDEKLVGLLLWSIIDKELLYGDGGEAAFAELDAKIKGLKEKIAVLSPQVRNYLLDILQNIKGFKADTAESAGKYSLPTLENINTLLDGLTGAPAPTLDYVTVSAKLQAACPVLNLGTSNQKIISSDVQDKLRGLIEQLIGKLEDTKSVVNIPKIPLLLEGGDKTVSQVLALLGVKSGDLIKDLYQGLTRENIRLVSLSPFPPITEQLKNITKESLPVIISQPKLRVQEGEDDFAQGENYYIYGNNGLTHLYGQSAAVCNKLQFLPSPESGQVPVYISLKTAELPKEIYPVLVRAHTQSDPQKLLNIIKELIETLKKARLGPIPAWRMIKEQPFIKDAFKSLIGGYEDKTSKLIDELVNGPNAIGIVNKIDYLKTKDSKDNRSNLYSWLRGYIFDGKDVPEMEDAADAIPLYEKTYVPRSEEVKNFLKILQGSTLNHSINLGEIISLVLKHQNYWFTKPAGSENNLSKLLIVLIEKKEGEAEKKVKGLEVTKILASLLSCFKLADNVDSEGTKQKIRSLCASVNIIANSKAEFNNPQIIKFAALIARLNDGTNDVVGMVNTLNDIRNDYGAEAFQRVFDLCDSLLGKPEDFTKIFGADGVLNKISAIFARVTTGITAVTDPEGKVRSEKIAKQAAVLYPLLTALAIKVPTEQPKTEEERKQVVQEQLRLTQAQDMLSALYKLNDDRSLLNITKICTNTFFVQENKDMPYGLTANKFVQLLSEKFLIPGFYEGEMLRDEESIGKLANLFDARPAPSAITLFAELSKITGFDLDDFSRRNELDPYGNREKIWQGKDIEPGYFSKNLDRAKEVVQEISRIRVKTGQPDTQQLIENAEQALARYSQIRYIYAAWHDTPITVPGSAIKKPIKDFTHREIIQKIAACRESIVMDAVPPTAPADKNAAKLELLTLFCEAMYRTSGKFARSTQILSVLTAIFDPADVMLQINTGEGKTLISALNAAMLWGVNKTGHSVDVCTANMALAEHDSKEMKDFFTYLGVETALISASSPPNTYKQGGINYSDVGNLSLYRSRCKVNHDEIRPKSVSLVLDEADKSILDERMSYNYSVALDINQDLNTNEYDWIYPLVNKFLETDEFKNTKASGGEDILNLRVYLQRGANDEYKRNLLANVPDKQLDQWIESALAARDLKINEDFVIEAEQRLIRGEVKSFLVAHILINKRPSGEAKWSDGVQQLLHARLNSALDNLRNGTGVVDLNIKGQIMLALRIDPINPTNEVDDSKNIIKAIDESGKFRQDTFCIEREVSFVDSMTSKDVVDFYRSYKGGEGAEYHARGKIIAVSGTPAGSASEIEELEEKHKFNLYEVPPHNPSQRLDLVLQVVDDHKVHIKEIIQQVEEAAKSDKPILVRCESIKESEEIYRILLKNKALKSRVKGRLVNGLQLDGESKDIETDAGVSKAITVSTFDIKPKRKVVDPNTQKVVDPNTQKVTEQESSLSVVSTNAPSTMYLRKLLAEVEKEAQTKEKPRKVGRPILIHCKSIEESEQIHKFLTNEIEKQKAKGKLLKGYGVQLANGLQPELEQTLIDNAGHDNMITVSTLFERGTDIKPGSRKEDECGRREGLAVFVTHLVSERQVLQVKGRAGRQGQFGITAEIISGNQYPDVLKAKATKERSEVVNGIRAALDEEQALKRKYEDNQIGPIKNQLRRLMSKWVVKLRGVHIENIGLEKQAYLIKALDRLDNEILQKTVLEAEKPKAGEKEGVKYPNPYRMPEENLKGYVTKFIVEADKLWKKTESELQELEVREKAKMQPLMMGTTEAGSFVRSSSVVEVVPHTATQDILQSIKDRTAHVGTKHAENLAKYVSPTDEAGKLAKLTIAVELEIKRISTDAMKRKLVDLLGKNYGMQFYNKLLEFSSKSLKSVGDYYSGMTELIEKMISQDLKMISKAKEVFNLLLADVSYVCVLKEMLPEIADSHMKHVANITKIIADKAPPTSYLNSLLNITKALEQEVQKKLGAGSIRQPSDNNENILNVIINSLVKQLTNHLKTKGVSTSRQVEVNSYLQKIKSKSAPQLYQLLSSNLDKGEVVNYGKQKAILQPDSEIARYNRMLQTHMDMLKANFPGCEIAPQVPVASQALQPTSTGVVASPDLPHVAQKAISNVEGDIIGLEKEAEKIRTSLLEELPLADITGGVRGVNDQVSSGSASSSESPTKVLAN